MSVDIHVTAGCGCFVTSLGPAGVAVAMCKGHTATARQIFDREPVAVDQLLAGVYGDDARASERAKLAWWLRAGASGPAGVNQPEFVGFATELGTPTGGRP